MFAQEEQRHASLPAFLLSVITSSSMCSADAHVARRPLSPRLDLQTGRTYLVQGIVHMGNGQVRISQELRRTKGEGNKPHAVPYFQEGNQAVGAEQNWSPVEP